MKKRPAYDELLSRIAVLEEAVSAKDAIISAKDAVISDKDAVISDKDAVIARKEERIAYLERLLYDSKSDKMAAKAAMSNQPGLFDELFNEAYDERAAQIQQTAQEIKAEADKRRQAAKSAPKRPSKYQYHGLEERRREVNPEGLNVSDYEKIGEDETRILHREPAKVWVEVIVRRKFTDAQSSHPHQAQQAIEYIQLLYELEANLKARGATAGEIAAERQAKAILQQENDRGAEDNAVFYSLLESCQIAGVNQLQWLSDILQRLAGDASEQQLIAMLPYNYNKGNPRHRCRGNPSCMNYVCF